MIKQKEAEQGMSDLYVVFVMIPCAANFCIWSGMKLIFVSWPQIAFQSLYT